MDVPSYDYLTDGAAIYAESFRIIREESDLGRFPDDVSKVVVRMIHAAAQTNLVDAIAWRRGVLPRGPDRGRADSVRFVDGGHRHHPVAAARQQRGDLPSG